MKALPQNIRKMLLLLSSTQDGEVVAAARAIDRSLKAAGLDWHVLADGAVTTAAQSSGMPRPVQQAMLRRIADLERDLVVYQKALDKKVNTDYETMKQHRRWGWIGRSERLGWCAMLAEQDWIAAVDQMFLRELRRSVWERPDLLVGKQDIAHFNNLVKQYEDLVAASRRGAA